MKKLTIFISILFITFSISASNIYAETDQNNNLVGNITPNGQITAITNDASGNIYIGGDFTSINGEARNHLAELKANTYELLPFNPVIYKAFESYKFPYVQSLKVIGSTLYIGGHFDSINGIARNNLGAVNTTDGSTTSWNPNLDDSTGYVSTIEAGSNNDTIFIGGQFGHVGNDLRICIARLDLKTGKATKWDTKSNSIVNYIKRYGNTLYVAGSFTNIGGSNRTEVAAINISNALATDWNPQIDGKVNSIDIDSRNVYLGGRFMFINGYTKALGDPFAIASLNKLDDGRSKPWIPDTYGTANTIYKDDKKLYIGGKFNTNNSISNLGSFNLVTNEVNNWKPNPDQNGINTLLILNNNVFVGGDYTNIFGTKSPYFSILKRG